MRANGALPPGRSFPVHLCSSYVRLPRLSVTPLVATLPYALLVCGSTPLVPSGVLDTKGCCHLATA